jgi:hypothetical protein
MILYLSDDIAGIVRNLQRLTREYDLRAPLVFLSLCIIHCLDHVCR